MSCKNCLRALSAPQHVNWLWFQCLLIFLLQSLTCKYFFFPSLLHDNTGRICLLIHNANKKDAGWYTVSAVNGAGVATCHARLEVASKYHSTVLQPQPELPPAAFRTDPDGSPNKAWPAGRMSIHPAESYSVTASKEGERSPSPTFPACLLNSLKSWLFYVADKKQLSCYSLSLGRHWKGLFSVPAHTNKPVPAPKQLRVRPTFSKYLALNGRGLDVKQAFSPEGEFQRLAEQSGLYESDEL